MVTKELKIFPRLKNRLSLILSKILQLPEKYRRFQRIKIAKFGGIYIARILSLDPVRSKISRPLRNHAQSSYLCTSREPGYLELVAIAGLFAMAPVISWHVLFIVQIMASSMIGDKREECSPEISPERNKRHKNIIQFEEKILTWATISVFYWETFQKRKEIWSF